MFFPKQSNSIILVEKKIILLENKMNHDRYKMISLVLNKVAKWKIFLHLTGFAGFEGLGGTLLLKFPSSISPPPTPPPLSYPERSQV